jgi:hypothetical protein
VSARYSDQNIKLMLQERKLLPRDYRTQIKLRDKRGHKERELDIQGDNESQFKIIMRQSDFDQFDFSVILAFCPNDTNQIFRLRRYNGKSHQHTNKIEAETFYGFHIHMATERYQDLGTREDTYAEQTDRYSDLQTALQCMLEDCGFDVPLVPQRTIEDWI